MMKKYTEKDLETFKRDEQERLICPHCGAKMDLEG